MVLTYGPARFAVIIVLAMVLLAPMSQGADLPEKLTTLFDNHCVQCHDGEDAEGGLTLKSLEWNLDDPHVADIWVKIHDRLASGEMPPKEDSRLDEVERGAAVKDLASRIVRFQAKRYVQHGRAVSRRVNRFEYENILRDLLHDPYLKIADQLPLDGEVHGRTCWKAIGPLCPFFTIINTYIKAKLGTQEQQVGYFRILDYGKAITPDILFAYQSGP